MTRGFIYIMFIVFLLSCKEKENAQTEWDKNNTRAIDSEDVYLNKSVLKAKENLGFFIREFKKSKDIEKYFFVKIKLQEEERVEHIWIQVLKINDKNSIGLLSNVPSTFENYKYLDSVSFDISKSEDLMIMKNDSIIFGAFLQKELKTK